MIYPNKKEWEINKMRVIVCKDYDEMSKKAADIIAAQVVLNPNSVLGLATGSTPVGTYKNLIKMYNEGTISFKGVTTFNLDEYYPIQKSNSQSYDYFMNDNLFSHIDIDKANVNIPNGEAADAAEECKRYEAKIAKSPRVDIQILGIGQNGHIAFNEPDDALISETHLTGLTDNTIEANARFFDKKEDVPTNALTMGIGTIMQAKKIIILANGEAKKDAVRDLLSGKITTSSPATMLNAHNDVIVICDEAAYSNN